MKFLLDVNALIALGWADHVAFERVGSWFTEAQSQPASVFMTTPIVEVGFVRISMQRSKGEVPLALATETLAQTVAMLRPQHEFLADDLPAGSWPAWCKAASQTTEAHLLALATRHEAQLATLDAAIPGAFLIPA